MARFNRLTVHVNLEKLTFYPMQDEVRREAMHRAIEAIEAMLREGARVKAFELELRDKNGRLIGWASLS